MFDGGSLLLGLLAILGGIWMALIVPNDVAQGSYRWIPTFLRISGVVVIAEGLFLIAGTFGLVPMTGVQWYIRIPGR